MTRRELDRRSFLKQAAIATSAAAAVPFDLAAAQSPAEVEWRKAPCRMCGVGCGLLIGIQDGRAVQVKGDPSSPVSRGLACVKGYYSIQALYARDRITRPLVYRNGSRVTVPMSEALDLVADRLRETIDRHGKDAVAMYGSAQWTLADALVATRFVRGTIGTRHFDTSARLYTASAEAGLLSTFGLAGMPGTFEDIDHADVFILWDIDMAETDPVVFSRMLERRRTNPAVRIIDLATRTTRTSYASDRSLLYRSHGEIAIANAICRVMIDRRMTNRDFVDRYVSFRQGASSDSSPAEELRPDEGTAVDWNAFVSFLADYSPEHAQRLSGLAAADVAWLASLYGDPTLRVVTAWGARVNQQSRGSWLNNALHNIHLLTGKMATPGNAALSVTTAAGGASLAHDLMGHRGVAADADGRERAAQALGVAPAAVDTRPTLPALSIFRAIERGDVRFLWIQATNPLVSLPNLSRYRTALRNAGAFLVVSEAYPTPTTDVADVVLPAALWIEREGVYANAERRAQHFDQLVRPPGDAMSDAQQVIEVARRLAGGAPVPWDPSRIAAQAWDELGTLHREPSRALPSYAALRSTAGLLWPAPGGEETRWRYNTAHDPAADASRGAFDFYGHDDHRAWIWLRPHESPPESPDAQYPYWFSAGRVVEHWGTGTLTRRVPTLHRALPRAYVEINGDDARALGIRDRDIVRLTSRRGSLQAEARIDYRSQPPRGCVFAPAFDEGVAVNLLTLDMYCAESGQPDYGACAVRLERVGTS